MKHEFQCQKIQNKIDKYKYKIKEKNRHDNDCNVNNCRSW